jgi:hydrogenase nickel incorporation protein HypA/HybF
VHERALMQDVMKRIDAAARADGAARVTRITVRLGALSHFTAERFREDFSHESRGTIAEGAEVDALVESDITAARASEVVLESVEVEH